MCSADSPSRHVRLWWNERRHDEQTVPERFEKPGAPTYTDPPTDANCRTRPQIVQFLARAADELLARDRSLGLPAPRPDSGMPARWGDPSRPDSRVFDGGSGALDLYLSGGTGFNRGDTECVTWERPRGRRHAAAFMHLFGVRTFNDADLDRLRHDLAHELVHVAQCAVTNERGDVTGTMIDTHVVEATAEAYAVATTGALDAATIDPALRLPHPVLAFQIDAYPATQLYYAEYAFWYRLFKAPSARTYAAFLRRAAAQGRRVPSATLVEGAFSREAVQQALTAFASFALLGGSLGNAHFDATAHFAEWKFGADLTPAAGAPAGARLVVRPYGYAFVRIRWPDGVDRLSLSVSGAGAAEVAAGTREGGAVTPAGSTWTITRSCTASGACDGDGYAYAAVANGRRSTLRVALTVR
jgi:hypothetical protein